MSDVRPTRWRRLQPWAALLMPPVAWMLFEYGLATSLRPACDAIGRWLGPAWGAASLLACLGAAGLAYPLSRQVGGAEASLGAWLARLALVGAGVFALAIALQTLATLIVPSCAR